ncbi:hypothetical protein [Methanobrevibacter curvatus]|uniref:PIN domain-containing protein n=1 Tax=Methanobrevibacter curvatus TaxID=49547 RepID=A0A166ANS7_9EURY|nr:hypothetical protein [Methanobrevibacter curvatus]KZX12278.1 hypothetical protein MBCUR_11300 [Methanobrevibacter curvatus]
MGLFLDTNVLISFIFDLHPWNGYAENLFKTEKKKHWSNTVKNESIKVIDSLKNKYIYIFEEIINKLSLIDRITEKKFITTVINISGNEFSKKDKKVIANIIWERGGWYRDILTYEIIDLIKTLLYNLNIDLANRYNKCVNILNKPYFRAKNEKYLSVFNNLEKIKNIHTPDDIIIVDAHHLAIKQMINKFITGDLKIIKLKQDLIDCTAISDFVSLNSFNY